MALQTATNKETGESVVLVGGEWKPVLQTASNKAGAKAYLVGNEWLTDEPASEAPAKKPAPTPAQQEAPTDAMGADIGSTIMGAASPREKKVYTGSVFDTQPFNPPFDSEEATRLSRRSYAEQTTRAPRRAPPEMRATPEEQVRGRTGTEIYKDTTLGVFQGGIGFLKGVADNVGAGNNPASAGLEAVDLALERLKTPQLRGSAIARQGQIERARETQGELAATRAAFNTLFSPAGADIVAKGGGSMIPTLGMSLINLGVKSMAMANALSNAGDAANQAAENLKRLKPEEWSNNEAYQALREKGMSHKDAVAMLVPLYVVPAQTTGLVTGYLSGRTGLEKSLAGKGQGTALGRGAAELLGEEVETLAPQLVGNLVTGAIDERTSPLTGLGQAAVETAAAAGPGSLVSAVKGAPTTTPTSEQPREGAYERDLSYTGEAERMARERGFLTPEAKPQQTTGQVQPAPTPDRIEPTLDEEALVAQTAAQEEKPVPAPELSKEERIDALAERIATRGVSPEEARRVATLQVESDIRKKLAADEAAAEELPTYYPKDKTREAEIFRELVDQGVPPDQARGMAKEQLTVEKEDRKIAAAQTRYLKKAKKDAATAAATEGAADVGQPISEAGGVSPELAGEPSQEQPAGGAGEPATDGVVPTGADVVPTGEGEAVEPAALAEEQPVEEAPAAEAAPKGKRGRKPLAPEQRAVSEQKRQQQKLDANAAARAVARQEQELASASEPLNEDDFDTDEALKTAQEEQRQRRQAVIRALYDLSKANRNKPGQRAAELLKNSATPKEIADAKASYEYRKSRSLTSQNVMSNMPPSEADSGFSKVTNGAQALARVLKTGNGFEKLLAARILAFVRNVRVVVIEQGQELPAQLQKAKNAKAWEGARGLFIENDATGDRVVYLRGDSFGEDQGVNNVTVLHELLHAATNQKLYLGLTAIKQGFSGDAPLTKATKDILRTMRNAQEAYLKLKAVGRAPAEIEDLVYSTRGEIFALPHEFLAYGMSDPTFQKFLMDTKGEEEDTSFFSQFVTAIRDFFKMSDDTTNALTDLIVATDKLVSAQKTERMRFLEKANQALAQREGAEDRVSQQVKPGTLSKTAQPDTRTDAEIKKDVAVAQQKVIQSRAAEELAQNTSALQLATDPKKLVEATRRAYDASTYEANRLLVNGFTTDYLVEVAKDEIPQLENTWRNIQEMHGMTASLMEGAVDPSTVLFNVVKENPAEMRPLYDIALEATLAEIDPAVDRRSPALNKKFDALSDKAKYAYMAIRDYFVDMQALYSTLLDDQVNELSASNEDKANLLTKLKTIYEVGGNIVPYFSLVRRGEFWLRVGGGKNRQFYMFKTMQERDKVASELAKQRRQDVEELIADRDFQIGNDLRSLRLDSYDTSAPKLTALMDAIDGMQLSGGSEADVAEQKNRLKDSVYQLYLMSLPDQSFRKKFISREGITGFNTDLLQNFSDTATTMAVQLSRIKYGRRIRNALLAARSSIAERPELIPFVEEMEDRVRLELPSTYDESKVSQYGEAAANLATRASFLYFLSGVSSALLQPISVLQFAYPLLGARHGYANVAAEFTKMLKVWNAYSIKRTNSDGSVTYIMPTLRNSGAVQMDGMEQRAMQQMIGRNVGQVTLSGELMARREEPTDVTVSTPRRYAKNVWWGATGALMQTAERLAQEMVYLTSFRSTRKAAEAKFRKSQTYKTADDKVKAMADFARMNFQSWVDQAVVDTHESLGNMTQENRPPAMRGAVGKVALQFHMFPLHATIQLGKNAKRMILPLKPGKRAEPAKIFWGQMATTALLVGASGLPMFYTLVGFLSGMWRDWQEERDLMPADLREMDFTTWFKQKFLPEQFGAEWAKVIDRGLLNYATGADFSSRLSLSNMWLREGKETRTEREAATQVLVDHMGATVSQGLTYADAMKDFRMGNYRDGIQKMSPAFIRNWISMDKLRTEGAKDTKGNLLISKDAVSTGELIWRAVGFNSDKLADLQTTNFKVIGMQQRIDNERNDILDKLDTHYRNRDLKKYGEAYKDMEKFNTKYPWKKIDSLSETLGKRQERRGQSWRGVNVNKGNAPYAVEALATSRLAVEEAERKAREAKE